MRFMAAGLIILALVISTPAALLLGIGIFMVVAEEE